MSDAPESSAGPSAPAPPPHAGGPGGSGGYRPVRPPPPPPRSSPVLGCAFALSFGLNLLAGLVILLGCVGVFALRKPDTSILPLTEQHYAGESGTGDKIAVVTLDGVILEGLMSFVHKQIEQAAGDRHVKAVILRINSPGGSITASDELHRRLVELRDGSARKKRDPRPLIVSMGAMAASGGYYVAMPGQTLFAERTTLTGSIGVYSSFPNVKELGQKIGVSLTTIKQGQIKDSASPFKDMTAHEREVWQDLVDEAYQSFLKVVEQGRPALQGGKLLQTLKITPVGAGPDFLHNGELRKPYERYLADGGVWTAEKALQFQLIDKIGSLDDAIQAAHDAASLGEDYRVIKYERPSTLAELLGLGVRSPAAPAGSLLDPARLEGGFLPRLWYLAPGAETSGFLAATRTGDAPR